MREAGVSDGGEAVAARGHAGDGDGRDERWVCLRHDAAYYAARAVAEGRLRAEAARGPVQGLEGADVVGTGLPATGGRG